VGINLWVINASEPPPSGPYFANPRRDSVARIVRFGEGHHIRFPRKKNTHRVTLAATKKKLLNSLSRHRSNGTVKHLQLCFLELNHTRTRETNHLVSHRAQKFRPRIFHTKIDKNMYDMAS
jgi:hypothetical protein